MSIATQIRDYNYHTFEHFETEEEAIQSLVDDHRTFETFIILKEIYITNF